MLLGTNKVVFAVLAFGVMKAQFLGTLSATLVVLLFVYAAILNFQSYGNTKPGAPGPNPFPIIGSLHLMHGYRVGYLKKLCIR